MKNKKTFFSKTKWKKNARKELKMMKFTDKTLLLKYCKKYLKLLKFKKKLYPKFIITKIFNLTFIF